MDFYIDGFSDQPYKIEDLDQLSTPCLLIFQDRFEYNLNKMKDLLASTAPGFGLASLWPHAKTHKSKWVTRRLMEAGIRGFKASPNEVDMLLEAGVETIFVAYPLLGAEARRLARLSKENPEVNIMIQAAHPDHLEILAQAAQSYDIKWPCFIDLDVGMHRTGTSSDRALQLGRSIAGNPCFQFAGLHGYGGHNSSPDLEERRRTSRESVDLLLDLYQELKQEGVKAPRLIMSGTPGFLTDLECLVQAGPDAEILLSPGTWVYFDTKDAAIMPDTFSIAALILAQVIDRPQKNTATLNIGYKRWAIDQGPIEGFSLKGMKAAAWSEEHTVVTLPGDMAPAIGDFVLIAPRHVCSTVNLWETFSLIGPDGRPLEINRPIEARNR